LKTKAHLKVDFDCLCKRLLGYHCGRWFETTDGVRVEMGRRMIECPCGRRRLFKPFGEKGIDRQAIKV